VVRDAVVFDPTTWRERLSMESDRLLETVALFFDALDDAGVDYVLVGGIAMLQYVRGRNTRDIDVIAAAPALRALDGFEAVEDDANFVRGRFEGVLDVDLLLPENPVFAHVRRHHVTTHRFLDRAVRCATVEGLVLLKLYALPSLYRQGDFARVGLYENDVATLLFYHDPDLGALWPVLDAHLSRSDAGEVRRIVADLRRRIDRFEQGDA
jgi:hypothetical protein